MQQLNFTIGIDAELEAKLLKDIKTKRIPTMELAKIRDSYYKHLKNTGAPSTYSTYSIDVINAINEHFPYVIDKQKCQVYINQKVQRVYDVIGELIEQKKFNISNQTIQMYLEHIKPELKNNETTSASTVTLKIQGLNQTEELAKF